MKDPSPASRTSRSKRQLRVWIGASVLLIAVAAWIFRPHFHADQSLVEPRLRALQKPYREVLSSYMFDGGSVLIVITDAGGHSERFYIPSDTNWKTVYVGALTETRWPPHTPVSNDEATLQELTAILSDHCDDELDYRNLETLTGRLSDRWNKKFFEGQESLAKWWKNVKL